MSKRNTDVLEVLISQMGKYRNVDFAFAKAFRILGHDELFEPVRNLLHRGPSSSDVPGEQDKRSNTAISSWVYDVRATLLYTDNRAKAGRLKVIVATALSGNAGIRRTSCFKR